MADDATESPDDSQPVPAAEILIQPEQMAGVWANVASISQTVHEFTLDFIRMDGSAPSPGRGIVVARIAFSPLLAGQLADLLNTAWQQYAQVPDAPEGNENGPQDPEEPAEGQEA